MNFNSDDQNNAVLPASDYVVRITAKAGTNLDVANYVEFDLILSCLLTASQFNWKMSKQEESNIIRRDYIPGWTLPQSFMNPLDPLEHSPAYNEISCIVETPITWFYKKEIIDD